MDFCGVDGESGTILDWKDLMMWKNYLMVYLGMAVMVALVIGGNWLLYRKKKR